MQSHLPKLFVALSYLCLGCLCLGPGAHADERLDIRTGSWEITSTTQITGTPMSRDMLTKMTPQQRAEIEAAMKAEAAKGPQTEVTHECVTAEDLGRPFASADTKECTQSIARTTRTTQEVRLECSGERKGSGLLRVSAPNPQAMTATLDLRAGDGAAAFTVKSQMKGKWLGPKCEDEDAPENDETDDSAPDEFDEPEDEDR